MLKQDYVEIGLLCDLAPPYSFQVQQHCGKYKSQVCNTLSDVMLALTKNKIPHIITMVCVENLYLEVNMYVTLWSYPLTEVMYCRNTPLQNIVPSTGF